MKSKLSILIFLFWLSIWPFSGKSQKVVKTYWDSYTHKKLQKQYITTNDGFLNGLYKEWYSNGTPQRTVMYKLDKKDGSYKEWWPNSNLKVNGAFVSDVRQGWFSWYTERGALFNQKLYTNGVVIEEKDMFNIPGTPLKTHTWYGKDEVGQITIIAKKTYRENGKPVKESVWPSDGNNGWDKEWFSDPERTYTVLYDNDLRKIGTQLCRENGKLWQETLEPHDGINGWGKSYFKSGKLRISWDINRKGDELNLVNYDLDGITVVDKLLDDQ